MGVEMIQYIIVCPLVFLAGFIDAIAGGGGLISLPAYMLAGVPVHFAIGTNKMSSSMGTVIATYRFAKNGYIKLKLAACSVICALLGSPLGAMLSLKINDSYLKLLMLVILPVTAFYVLRKRDFNQKQNIENDVDIQTYFKCMLIAFLIGAYDGFYGPGTGTFLILLLTGIANLSLNNAAGTTKAINLSSNIAGLATFIINAKVLFPLGIAAGLFSIAGNYFGAGYFTKSGAKIARPVIITVLSIFLIKVLIEML